VRRGRSACDDGREREREGETEGETEKEREKKSSIDDLSAFPTQSHLSKKAPHSKTQHTSSDLSM
jgi:hypothetical protein